MTKPKWSDFVDDEDPRGPSTTEMNSYRAAVDQWENGQKRQAKKKRLSVRDLLEEAERELLKSKRKFKRYDDIEDLRKMESWKHVINWLKTKLNT